mmetsp:Transcript_67327/g.121285  ORF Transcript_67327/g.121285 Transcript_67327/m.121285 type:complete len:209 (-) Transcript_67327:2165-2791(-)
MTDLLVARLRAAGLHLHCSTTLAQSSAVLRYPQHPAFTVLHAPPARDAALPPSIPSIPLAIFLACAGERVVALSGLTKWALATHSTIGPQALDLASASLDAHTAGPGACTPLAPAVLYAVQLVAVVAGNSAADGLHEIAWARLPSILRKALDLALSLRLAIRACPVTVAPLRPCRNLAIQDAGIAGLCLHQHILASFAAAHGWNRNTP